MKKYTPSIIEHVKVCGKKNTFCAHPVEAGSIYNFGNNEIALMHLHTENVEYSAGGTILHHGQTGIHGKAKVILTRSYDGGRTWPKEEHVVVFDQGQPVEVQQAFLANRITEQEAAPVTENTIFHFGKSFCGPFLSDGVRRELVTFILRSEDKGRTWSEKVSVPDKLDYAFIISCGGAVRQGDRWLKPFIASVTPDTDNNSIALYQALLYSSENNGVDWQYVSTIARDPFNDECHSYANMVDFGNGHLMATTGGWNMPSALTRWINAAHSYDNGLNWEPYTRIQSFGISPYPLLLKDGRVVVLYVKRYPFSVQGVYGIVSDDQGQTWSEEFCLRQDASGPDIGYPVATQLDDGSVFVAYYYMTEDGQDRDGARYIAGTIFTI